MDENDNAVVATSAFVNNINFDVRFPQGSTENDYMISAGVRISDAFGSYVDTMFDVKVEPSDVVVTVDDLQAAYTEDYNTAMLTIDVEAILQAVSYYSSRLDVLFPGENSEVESFKAVMALHVLSVVAQANPDILQSQFVALTKNPDTIDPVVADQILSANNAFLDDDIELNSDVFVSMLNTVTNIAVSVGSDDSVGTRRLLAVGGKGMKFRSLLATSPDTILAVYENFKDSLVYVQQTYLGDVTPHFYNVFQPDSALWVERTRRESLVIDIDLRQDGLGSTLTVPSNVFDGDTELAANDMFDIRALYLNDNILNFDVEQLDVKTNEFTFDFADTDGTAFQPYRQTQPVEFTLTYSDCTLEQGCVPECRYWEYISATDAHWVVDSDIVTASVDRENEIVTCTATRTGTFVAVSALAPTPSNSVTPSNTPSKSSVRVAHGGSTSSDDDNAGMIAGIVIGAVVFLGGLASIHWWFSRRSSKVLGTDLAENDDALASAVPNSETGWEEGKEDA